MLNADLFDAQKRLELDIAIRDISQGTKGLDSFCESIRDEMVSRDAERRTSAINQLAYCVTKLPPSSLNGTEADNILDFLINRLNDTGHLSELLVSAIHHLFFAANVQDVDQVDRIFHNIFDDNSVQSYVQTDRLKFLEIFEYVVKNHFQVIENADNRFYSMFSNAVTGERDPRCLLKVFRIFTYAMKRLDLGGVMEEMFELVACYYPIDYSPRAGETNPLSANTLSAACESCLLANRAFSFYTLQLIAEKLLEDEENVGFEQKLRMCRFLEDACEKFGPNALLPMLNDFLAAFRMLTLNPNRKAKDDHSVEVVGSCLRSILKALETMGDRAKPTIEGLAQEMLENCEPFVLQAEMGLSLKAISLLEKMAISSHYTAESVVSKVFYWLYALITGLTIKNIANKEEIVEETLLVVPKWLEIAQSTGQLSTVLQSCPALFDAINNSDCVPRHRKLQVLCRLASLFLSSKDVNLPEELNRKFQIVFDQILDLTEGLDSETGPIIFTFLRFYSIGNVERIGPLTQQLKEADKWTSQQFLYCAALIKDPTDDAQLLNLFLDQLTNCDNVDVGTSHLLFVFKNLKVPFAANINEKFIAPLFRRLIENKPKDVKNQVKIAIFLQELGVLLTNDHFSFLVELCLKQFAMATTGDLLPTVTMLVPVCLLDPSTETPRVVLKNLKKLMTTEEVVQLRPYITSLCFALKNRGARDEFDESVSDFPDLQWELDVCWCRSELLTENQFPVDAVTRILNEAPASVIPELLNFNSTLTDPSKCNFRSTFMWTQRLLVQFVPFFSNYFTQLKSQDRAEDRDRRQAVVSLVAPILQLAKRVPIQMTNELKLLFPILVEALDRSECNDHQLPLLLDVSTQLLHFSTADDFTPEKFEQLSSLMEKFLKLDGCPPAVSFASLQLLEQMAKRAPPRHQIFRWESTLSALQHVAHSKKRILRLKAASVRNLWEIVKS